AGLTQSLQDTLALDILQSARHCRPDWTRRLQLIGLDLQNASGRQYHGSFDEVLELSYVPRPRITTKGRHRLFRNRLNSLVHALRILVHVMTRQKRYVPRPLPQRWNPNRKNVQPKIQILAKCFSPTICAKSRLVAATIRTSTRCVRVLPRRSN